MKVVIAEPIVPNLDELISKNKKDWIVYEDKPKDRQELVDRISDAEIVSAYSVRFNEQILSLCPKLQFLVIPAVGAESYVDMEAAKQHGVTVLNCPGYNSMAVAEMAVGLILNVIRRISMQNDQMKSDMWQEFGAGTLLGGKTVGLIGYGNVGKTIEKLLGGWNCSTNHVNSSSNPKDMDKLMQSSDMVIVCCPLNEATKGLVSVDRLKLMKKTAVLINVGRGAVVDEDALYEMLVSGQIAGAGLDVFNNEPEFTAKIPENISRFSQLDNVVCTPHVAGTSVETRNILGQMIFENIESCENGKLKNIFVV